MLRQFHKLSCQKQIILKQVQQCHLAVFGAPSAMEIGATDANGVEVSIIRFVAALLEQWRSQKEEQDVFIRRMEMLLCRHEELMAACERVLAGSSPSPCQSQSIQKHTNPSRATASLRPSS